MTPPLFPAQKTNRPQPERLAIDAVTRQPLAPAVVATPEPAPPPFSAGALNRPPAIPKVETARSTAPIFADVLDALGAEQLPAPPPLPEGFFTADSLDEPGAAAPQAPPSSKALVAADSLDGPKEHALPASPALPETLFTADALDWSGGAAPQAPEPPWATRAASTVKAPAMASASRATRAGEIHARPASLWRRLIATFVDAAILGGIVAAYLAIAARVSGARIEPSAVFGLEALVHNLQAFGALLLPAALLAIVLGGVYAAAFALVWGGRTPGRWFVGIRLVDATGYAPGPWRALLRAVLSLFSFGLLLAGFWLAVFDRRGQTLHDKLTSTFLVQPS